MPINMEKGSMGGGGEEEEEGELEAEKRKRKRKKEKERGRVGGGQWQIHKGSDCDLQCLQFRPVPPGMGGTYRSARLPVRGPPATGRKKKRGIKNTSPAPSSPACHRHSRVARARLPPVGEKAAAVPAGDNCGRFFSRARRRSVSPRKEAERLPA
ncbi:hypothetical protein BHM03_00035400, partial [Ensete ventricosum]